MWSSPISPKRMVAVASSAVVAVAGLASGHPICVAVCGLGEPPASLSPLPPVLVAPPHGSIESTADVNLVVNVADPDLDLVDVTLHGRPLAGAGGDPFTIIALPDTQNYSQDFPQIFEAQTRWIINKRSTLNIAYVAHLGDIVNHAWDLDQWDNADAALSILDSLPDLPYGLGVGNHDQDPIGRPDGTKNYNAYFPYTRYEGTVPWYGGHYGTDNDNHYVLFSASGMDFVAIHLEYDNFANPDVLDWAESVLQAYSSHRAIVVSHHIIGAANPADFGPQGAAIYNALKDNANLFMMLCGHWLAAEEAHRVDVYNGSKVHTLMSNYQLRPNGGDGWLRIMEFVPQDNQINVRTYSPTLDQFETDLDSQLTITYDMSGSSCPWDLTGDGFVGISDLLILLAAWGPNPDHSADFSGDDFVGINDLLTLLANWGACP
ncbi:MAG: metallophosphoesterase family protein [Planctomycetota bacterium]|jgi:hypothetical protein